ncbi:hypothetical protein PJ900_13675 [Tistrella mobilis]|uniref:Uncharacterized protein n=1 Tax=Tistrella mobilis TaxID=171437 RepID=A0A162L2J0_9PROT|nr:hypothetical protein [Tistrella mobilis]KYO52920.1 hypothetical protein AUP44_04290 [Tistrella mobilis]
MALPPATIRQVLPGRRAARLRLVPAPVEGGGPSRALVSISWSTARGRWTLSAGVALRNGPGAAAHRARAFPAPLIWAFLRVRLRPRRW